VRITGRSVMGVTLVRVDADEHVTSVFPVVEEEPDAEAEQENQDG
jgi:DNA gyrase subunit A